MRRSRRRRSQCPPPSSTAARASRCSRIERKIQTDTAPAASARRGATARDGRGIRSTTIPTSGARHPDEYGFACDGQRVERKSDRQRHHRRVPRDDREPRETRPGEDEPDEKRRHERRHASLNGRMIEQVAHAMPRAVLRRLAFRVRAKRDRVKAASEMGIGQGNSVFVWVIPRLDREAYRIVSAACQGTAESPCCGVIRRGRASRPRIGQRPIARVRRSGAPRSADGAIRKNWRLEIPVEADAGPDRPAFRRATSAACRAARTRG